MLRRSFLSTAPLALTEGARLLAEYHETGVEPGTDGHQSIIDLDRLVCQQYEWQDDQQKALRRALSATRKGWTNIGVCGIKGHRGHLVGVNPQTGRVELLP